MTVIGRAEVGVMSVGEAAILEVLKDIRDELKRPQTVAFTQTINATDWSEEDIERVASKALYHRLAGER